MPSETAAAFIAAQRRKPKFSLSERTLASWRDIEQKKNAIRLVDTPVDDNSFLEIYLQPEEFYWGEKDTRLKTILGSCVAVCMWHPRLHIGGMSHSLLPSRTAKMAAANLSPRYVDEAIVMFCREIKKAETRPAEYIVKIFGGANMLKDASQFEIGIRNLKTCETDLAAAGFRIASQHTGGSGPRNIVLDLWSGDTWLKKFDTP